MYNQKSNGYNNRTYRNEVHKNGDFSYTEQMKEERHEVGMNGPRGVYEICVGCLPLKHTPAQIHVGAPVIDNKGPEGIDAQESGVK